MQSDQSFDEEVSIKHMKREIKSESRDSCSSSYEDGEIRKKAKTRRNQAVTRENQATRHRDNSSHMATRKTQNVTQVKVEELMEDFQALKVESTTTCWESRF